MHSFSRYFFPILLFFSSFFMAGAQPRDTTELKALYERLYLLPKDQSDSIEFYAKKILAFSQKKNYLRGLAYGERLMGIASEYKEDTRAAIDHYLTFQGYAEKIPDTLLVASALSDGAGIYLKIENYQQAKANYLQFISLMASLGQPQKLAKGYSNLGVAYRKTNEYDSALYFYEKGLAIRKTLNDSTGMATVQNNIASLLLFQGRPAEALPFIKANLYFNKRRNSTEDLWYDYTNLAGAYTLLKNWALAKSYGDSALQFALMLESKQKMADTYEILVEWASQKGDFKLAYDFQTRQMGLLRQLNNEENTKAIAELQEKFNAQKREQENKLLTSEVSNHRLQKRVFIFLSLGLLVFAAAIGYAFFTVRRANKKTKEQNKLFQKQNQKLAELNSEKNALISIVSHDLSGPLSEIGLWHRVLAGSRATFSTEQQRKAIDRIGQATRKGEMMIQGILEVEKSETNQHNLELEEIKAGALLEHLMIPYYETAKEKKITLEANVDTTIEHLTDRLIFERIAENLISNALKYTMPGGKVSVSLVKEKAATVLTVADNGVGIAADELPQLFSKYARISNKPTGDEPSTGLGLSIVKRLTEELNAKIEVKSSPGEGSVFWVLFS